MTDTIPLADLLRDYTPGDAWDWKTEMGKLKTWFPHNLAKIRNSIQEHGIREPILLGNDGRVWDGHHRITAAHQLGIEHVPIEYAGDDDE